MQNLGALKFVRGILNKALRSISKDLPSPIQTLTEPKKKYYGISQRSWAWKMDTADTDIAHDEVTYRVRSRGSFIPQAERYSSKDWLHNLRTIPTSRLLRRIRGVLLFNLLWSVVVYVVYSFSQFTCPGAKAHSLLGSALGLLLVFRTNTAYNRFWEGRKIWEGVLNSLRCFGRLVIMYSEHMKTTNVEKLLHLCCAYPICLQEYVQGFRQPKILEELLSKEDILAIDRLTNRPYYITNLMAKELLKIDLSERFTGRERMAMQKHIEDLTKAIGACEKIVQTPVPLTYARHTSRFLSLFCLTAPVALVSELGFYIIIFVPLTTWSLFGILEIGMIIEEPFQRALKLEVFANTIRRDLADLLHVTGLNSKPLNIASTSLRYEAPFYSKKDGLTSPLENVELSSAEISQIIHTKISNGDSTTAIEHQGILGDVIVDNTD